MLQPWKESLKTETSHNTRNLYNFTKKNITTLSTFSSILLIQDFAIFCKFASSYVPNKNYQSKRRCSKSSRFDFSTADSFLLNSIMHVLFVYFYFFCTLKPLKMNITYNTKCVAIFTYEWLSKYCSFKLVFR